MITTEMRLKAIIKDIKGTRNTKERTHTTLSNQDMKKTADSHPLFILMFRVILISDNQSPSLFRNNFRRMVSPQAENTLYPSATPTAIAMQT